LSDKSLFNRTFETIVNKRERLLNGKINCIPLGLPRFENELPGIEQGKSYLITANSKVGKSQIADWLFLYNTIQQVIDNGLDIRLKIFYFTLEMTAEQKMLSAFSNILYVKEGIRIAPKDLRSTRADNILSQKILDIIQKYEPYFKKIEEVVEFIDSVRNPTGIYNLVRDYAIANGTIFYRDIEMLDRKTGQTKVIQVEDHYEPNDPDEYVIVIVDHISLLTLEKNNDLPMNLHETITKLSADYFVKLRNRFNYIPVVIQQQMSSQESIENKKYNKLKPSLDGLADNKTTQRDFDYIIGLFSPFRHEIPEYYGYNITVFRDNIRFLEILGGREGGGGTICPLYFDGAVNYFKELPKPDDKEGIKVVYDFLKNIKR
jgi:hypothetical protein